MSHYFGSSDADGPLSYNADSGDDPSGPRGSRAGSAGGATGSGSKVAQACLYCRHRRIRCDGANPCTSCAQRNRECEYPNEPPKKRGPKSQKQRDTEVAGGLSSTAPSGSGPRSLPVTSPASHSARSHAAAPARTHYVAPVPPQASVPSYMPLRAEQARVAGASTGSSSSAHGAAGAFSDEMRVHSDLYNAALAPQAPHFGPGMPWTHMQPYVPVMSTARMFAPPFSMPSNAAMPQHMVHGWPSAPVLPAGAPAATVVSSASQPTAALTMPSSMHHVAPAAFEVHGPSAGGAAGGHVPPSHGNHSERHVAHHHMPHAAFQSVSGSRVVRHPAPPTYAYPIPTSREARALDLFFAQVNTSLEIVDEHHFKEIIATWATGRSAESIDKPMRRMWWCAHPGMEPAGRMQRPDDYAGMLEGALGGGIGRAAHLSAVDRAQLGQYHACLAVGYRLLHGSSGRPPADAPHLADHHYERARALVLSCVDEPSTSVVAGLLLMAHYNMGLIRFTAASLHASMAWRLARACGLTVDDAGLGSAARWHRQVVCNDLDPLPLAPRLLPLPPPSEITGFTPTTTSAGSAAGSHPEGGSEGAAATSTPAWCAGEGPMTAAAAARYPGETTMPMWHTATSRNLGLPPNAGASATSSVSGDSATPLASDARQADAAPQGTSNTTSGRASMPMLPRGSRPQDPSAPQSQTHVFSMMGYELQSGAVASALDRPEPDAVAVAADGTKLSAHYLEMRTQEVLAFALARLIHIRRGMGSKSSRREVWQLVDELVQIERIPGLNLSECKRATIGGLKAIMMRQAGDNASALEWAQRAVNLWGSIPLMKTSHSFVMAFVARHVALIALSHELQVAVAQLARGPGHGTNLSDPQSSSDSAARGSGSRSQPARTDAATASSAGGGPRSRTDAADDSVSVMAEDDGDGRSTALRSQASGRRASQLLPPLSEYQSFNTLAIMVGTVANHWPICARMYQIMMTEAGAMHRAATAALSKALHLGTEGGVESETLSIIDFLDHSAPLPSLVKSVSGSLPDVPIDSYNLASPAEEDGAGPAHREDAQAARLRSSATNVARFSGSGASTVPSFSHAVPPLFHFPVDGATGEALRVERSDNVDRHIHIMTSNLLSASAPDEMSSAGYASPAPHGTHATAASEPSNSASSDGLNLPISDDMSPLDVLCLVIQQQLAPLHPAEPFSEVAPTPQDALLEGVDEQPVQARSAPGPVSARDGAAAAAPPQPPPSPAAVAARARAYYGATPSTAAALAREGHAAVAAVAPDADADERGSVTSAVSVDGSAMSVSDMPLTTRLHAGGAVESQWFQRGGSMDAAEPRALKPVGAETTYSPVVNVGTSAAPGVSQYAGGSGAPPTSLAGMKRYATEPPPASTVSATPSSAYRMLSTMSMQPPMKFARGAVEPLPGGAASSHGELGTPRLHSGPPPASPAGPAPPTPTFSLSGLCAAPPGTAGTNLIERGISASSIAAAAASSPGRGGAVPLDLAGTRDFSTAYNGLAPPLQELHTFGRYSSDMLAAPAASMPTVDARTGRLGGAAAQRTPHAWPPLQTSAALTSAALTSAADYMRSASLGSAISDPGGALADAGRPFSQASVTTGLPPAGTRVADSIARARADSDAFAAFPYADPAAQPATTLPAGASSMPRA